ncbi:MAG: efflux RND transporter periplasmic adaptor subunit [Planctomycetota bacterium]
MTSDPNRPASGERPDLSRLRIRADVRRRRAVPVVPVAVLLGLVLGGAYVTRLLWYPALERLWIPAVLVTAVEEIGPSAAAPGTLTANGYVVAQRRAALAAKLTGRLEELFVMEGMRVKKGDVVARLEHTDLDAQLARAQADVTQAEAEMRQRAADVNRLDADLSEARLIADASASSRMEAEALHADAKAEMERQEALVQSDSTTQQARDHAKWLLEAASHRASEALAREQSAQARVASLGAQIAGARDAVAAAQAGHQGRLADRQLLEAQLEFNSIRAPFDGVVISKDAEVGEIVAPISGGALAKVAVVTIVDMQSLMVEADVNEGSISRIHADQPARIMLEAFPDQVYQASVFKIVPTANRQKATVEVKVAFQQLDEKIVPEMAARVFFLEGSESAAAAERGKAPRLFVARQAIHEQGGSAFVWLLRDGKVTRRTVTIGEHADRTEILEGVARGDQLVVNRDLELREGMKVRVAAAK